MTVYALKLSAMLWIVWGAVHAFAGGMIIAGDTAAGFQAIADAVPPQVMSLDYPEAVGGILNQHAWNLLWGGLVTIIGAIFIWHGNLTAIWVTAMVGGLLDLGYLMFVDLAGYVKFFPGTLMTIISASAILISLPIWFRRGRKET